MLASCWALSTRSLQVAELASASSRRCTSVLYVDRWSCDVRHHPWIQLPLTGPLSRQRAELGGRVRRRTDVTCATTRCLAGRRRPTLCWLCLCPRVRRRPDRDLRLRLRRPHRGPVGHRPAAARVGALPRRHRAPALRPQADRRGARVRARVPRPPLRPGREGAGHRLQLRERGDAARRPRAVRRARGRGDPTRPPGARSRPAGPAGSA